MSKMTTPVLIAMVIVVGLGNLVATFRLSQNVHNSSVACDVKANEAIGEAISARTSANHEGIIAVQNLITAVFTQHGSPRQIRAADLKAYGQFQVSVTRYNQVKIPPIATVVCG
jgi:hypothetical protein